MHSRPTRGVNRTALYSSAAAVAGGLCVAAGGQPAQPTPARRFTEKVPGTPIRIDLAPIPAGQVAIKGADGAATPQPVGPFWMSTTEITWDAYDVFVYALDEPAPGEGNGGGGGTDATTRPSKPYLPPDRGFGHEGYPTISVAYPGAVEFCKWLSKKTGRAYRLPTEAEWEYAARAGSTGLYAWGDDPAKIPDFAWFKDNAGDKTQSVRQKAPNAWGLFDVHGNVAEWCAGLDGKPVARGGSYLDDARGLRLEARLHQEPSWQSRDPQLPKSKWWLSDCSWVGFRVVCEGPGPGASSEKK